MLVHQLCSSSMAIVYSRARMLVHQLCSIAAWHFVTLAVMTTCRDTWCVGLPQQVFSAGFEHALWIAASVCIAAFVCQQQQWVS